MFLMIAIVPISMVIFSFSFEFGAWLLGLPIGFVLWMGYIQYHVSQNIFKVLFITTVSLFIVVPIYILAVDSLYDKYHVGINSILMQPLISLVLTLITSKLLSLVWLIIERKYFRK